MKCWRMSDWRIIKFDISPSATGEAGEAEECLSDVNFTIWWMEPSCCAVPGRTIINKRGLGLGYYEYKDRTPGGHQRANSQSVSNPAGV